MAIFVAVSAIPGGIALLAGFHSPPLAQLEGSVFPSFVIPGLALVFLVGGSAAAAAVLLVRRNRFAVPTAFVAGFAVMAFEFVEVLAIGFPPGPARVMQMLYFSIGAALVTVSSAILAWPADGRRTAPAQLQNISISSDPNLSTARENSSNAPTPGNLG